MPTYIYKREDGTKFEWFQTMNDDKLTHCPETGQTVKRLIVGGQQPILRGRGFYATEYSTEKHKQKLANDPLYTTLEDYKPKVEEFKEKNKISDKDKIQVGHG